MGDSTRIAPVAPVPAVPRVIQRDPRKKEQDNHPDSPAVRRELEEQQKPMDDSKKEGGLDCYG
ncbi:hypothetical protein Ga0123462_2104 [Mariprofundus ferrinatatus]|uniref:Uncharacterized protein n=1 Tax=Mariprofundus ferrinatatus TaxID=1921087 RepID=A0A2K8L9K9_9PROT|nr:hypothetical protein [Mariprofundus ferrinatatus]ATX82939.1 hypothetical protein Ga0123462_2104 [Mariprofundus ferrinatatus]